MAVQTPNQISLSASGYSTYLDADPRKIALNNACSQHGVQLVLDGLEQVKIFQSNVGMVTKVVDEDIRYVLSKYNARKQEEEQLKMNTTIEDDAGKLQKLNSAFDEFLVRDGVMLLHTPFQMALRAFQEITLAPSIEIAVNRKKIENRKQDVLAKLELVRNKIMNDGNMGDLEWLENELATFGNVGSYS